MRRWMVGMLLAWVALLAQAKDPQYRLDYRVGFDPAKGEAHVRLTVTPEDGRLLRLRFNRDPDRHGVFKGDGKVTRKGDRITWRPPADRAGTLHFRYRIDHQRGNGGYDARITPDWALLRADRLIPPARALATEGARAVATLRFELPPGWTNAQIGYFHDEVKREFRIDNPGRRFQQPLGWMIAGDVGTRKEMIEGMEVVVAAPKGEDMRRNDVLAFMNLSMREAKLAFGRLPPKLLVVGAGDPMWRGGLSAPNSLFLHADRPLVGEGGTSPLLHELVHVFTRLRGVKGQDWIAESFAEYYSIQIARRSGLVSETRTEKALALLREQGAGVRGLNANYSEGPRTARGVSLLVDLDAEIRKASGGRHSLDDLTRGLVGAGRVPLERLRELARGLIGQPSKVLADPVLGG